MQLHNLRLLKTPVLTVATTGSMEKSESNVEAVFVPTILFASYEDRVSANMTVLVLPVNSRV